LTLALYGRPAQFLAEALELAVGSEREQMLRNVVLGWVPWADVVSVALTSDEGASVLAVVAEIEVVGYARPESRESKVMALPGFSPVHMVFPQPRASTLAARYGAESTRTTALSVDQPLLYRVRRQIELPPGTRVVRTPDPLALKTAHIEASRTVSEAGGIIRDELRLNLPVGTVDPEAYVEFARNIQRVDDAYLHSTRIEMK
jgi:hypothetical protein